MLREREFYRMFIFDISNLLTPLVTPAYVLKMKGMAVLEGPDFQISRGNMPAEPPKGSDPSLPIS